ncbi:MAG: hypothetical protein ACOCX3_03340 [Chloroflexota bacterium]
MPIRFVDGDPTLTRAAVLAIDHNAGGRTEMGTLHTTLMRQQPAAFATYSKQTRQGRLQPGDYWLWHESYPALLFLVIRESSVGATRLRYIQSVALKLARDHRLISIASLALAPLGRPEEWPEIKKLLMTWFGPSSLPVIAYERYQPGFQADESALLGDAPTTPDQS